MKKVNTRDVPGEVWTFAKGQVCKHRSEPVPETRTRAPIFDGRFLKKAALRRRDLPDPAGQERACPFHSHSAQWEFYHVISGTGVVRDGSGTTPVEPGDAFVFGPGEAHQVTNDGAADLVLYIVADNPMGESCHYPDSGKWMVRSPDKVILRSPPLDYHVTGRNSGSKQGAGNRRREGALHFSRFGPGRSGRG